jgi:hypothetical protein
MATCPQVFWLPCNERVYFLPALALPAALFTFVVAFAATDLTFDAALPAAFSTFALAFAVPAFGFAAVFAFVLPPPKMRSQLSPKLGVEPVRTIGPLISTVFPLVTLPGLTDRRAGVEIGCCLPRVGRLGWRD